MRKILCLIFAFNICFLFIPGVYAQKNESVSKYTDGTELINKIGHRILKANDLPTGIKFKFSEEDHVNAYANIKNEVYVFKGLVNIVETEDELAGVIGHEIGHIVNSHTHKQTMLHFMVGPVINIISRVSEKLWITKLAEGIGLLSLRKVSRDDEYEADLTGVDLMIKAGYNPLGMVSILNKITGTHLDILSTHPSGDKRLSYLYNYLSYNYPSEIEGNFPTESYQKFKKDELVNIIADREADPDEYIAKQKELREERAERFDRIKSSSNKWRTSFSVLSNVLGQ